MTSVSRIFFLCPDVKHATGGVTKIYEFAQSLHDAGFAAFVVHGDRSFRPAWFESSVPVICRSETIVSPIDLLVVPEFMGAVLSQTHDVNKVLFTQAAFNPISDLFVNSEYLAVVSVSGYIKRYYEFAFSCKSLFSVNMGFDHDVFNPSGAPKKKQIAFMPRRRVDDSTRILANLKNRGALNGWSVAILDGLSSREVANVMRESMIFLSFSQREGFGLPPLEAMACGCLVVGFHGHGGAEFFDPSYCYPIPEDDICLFQETLEGLLLNPQIEAICKAKGHAAASAVSQKYTMQGQKTDVIKAFSSCMALAKDVKGLKPLALRNIAFEPSRFRASARHLKKAFVSLLT